MNELMVSILEGMSANLSGSRAVLEAEGISPPDGWPAGRREVGWVRGEVLYTVRRTRPPTYRGPMSGWTNGDWWTCVVCRAVRNGAEAPALLLLRRVQRRSRLLTMEGIQAHTEFERRFSAALFDQAFRRFFGRLPGVMDDHYHCRRMRCPLVE